jgi:hypothetical protein
MAQAGDVSRRKTPGIGPPQLFLSPGPSRQSDPRRLKYCMSKKTILAELRAKAAERRAQARRSDDQEAANEIFKSAAELEQQARDMEQGE